MGHLNSFSASGRGNLNKNFPKIQMPLGMFKLRFDWYITTVYPVQERNTSSTTTIGHIDGCRYLSTTALQSNASISICNELTNDTRSSRNKHFIISIHVVSLHRGGGRGARG